MEANANSNSCMFVESSSKWSPPNVFSQVLMIDPDTPEDQRRKAYRKVGDDCDAGREGGEGGVLV